MHCWLFSPSTTIFPATSFPCRPFFGSPQQLSTLCHGWCIRATGTQCIPHQKLLHLQKQTQNITKQCNSKSYNQLVCELIGPSKNCQNVQILAKMEAVTPNFFFLFSSSGSSSVSRDIVCLQCQCVSLWPINISCRKNGKIHNFCPQKFPVRQFITKILNFAMLTEPEIFFSLKKKSATGCNLWHPAQHLCAVLANYQQFVNREGGWLVGNGWWCWVRCRWAA